MTFNQDSITKTILSELSQLVGTELLYVSGLNRVTINSIDDTSIKATKTNESYPISVPVQHIRKLAEALAEGIPVSLERVFGASGNARSALEAMVAHCSNVGHIKANSPGNSGPKTIVWIQPSFHETGAISEVDASELPELERESPPTSSFIYANPEDQTCVNLTRSILAKPFTILTGGSGTGKTKLAESLATHLGNTQQSNSAIIAVGADWTDNRNVLGFVNHLRTDAESEKPTYQTTPVLDLLLRAKDDSKTPYFLILDEMNLSHVERYFSDFLSVMEQKDGQFDLHSEGPDDDDEFTLPVSGDSSVGVPQKLSYPQNLFVIGTVNIDETTYMFSPKVLDRANVIEFKVDETEFEDFLKNPGGYPKIPVAAPGVAEGFLELGLKAREDGGIDPIVGETARDIRTHLMDLFRMMQEARFEFAYRTGHEIFRYLRVSQHLAEDAEQWQSEDWKQDLDTQIIQKILPKLHGSIGRIAPLISALAHYCETGKKDEVPTLRNLVQSPFDRDTALFPRSAEKLREMAKTLSVEQFVSFIS